MHKEEFEVREYERVCMDVCNKEREGERGRVCVCAMRESRKFVCVCALSDPHL